MNKLGTVQVLADDRTVVSLRWTVDTFLRLQQIPYCRLTRYFQFRSETFYLYLQYSVDSKTYRVDLRWPFGMAPFLALPFSWKLSVESRDGKILPWAEGVEEELDMSKYEILYEPDVYNVKLGSLQDVEGLLHPDGPLIIIFELRSISNETAANPSPSLLQHPVEGEDVKKSPGQMKNRSTIDGAGARYPKTLGVMDIEDCEPDTFGHFQFQHYVYTLVTDLRPENAISLYQVADKHQGEELKLENIKNTQSVE